MKILEKVLVLLCIVGVVLKTFSIDGGAILSAVSFLMLSFFYLFLSFLFFNGIPLMSMFTKIAYKTTNGKKIIWSIFIGYAFTTILMGLLFVLMQWEGAKFMFTNGFLLVIVIALLSIVGYLIYRSRFQFQILIRTLILLSIYLFLFLFLS